MYLPNTIWNLYNTPTPLPQYLFIFQNVYVLRSINSVRQILGVK